MAKTGAKFTFKHRYRQAYEPILRNMERNHQKRNKVAPKLKHKPVRKKAYT